MMKTSDKLAYNTILLSVGSLFVKGIQFTMIPFISRWLSTENYGTFDVLCTYITLLLPLITLATGEAMFRFSASSERAEDVIPYVSNGFFLTMVNLGFTLILVLALAVFRVISQELLIPFCILLSTQLYNYYLQAFLRSVKRLPLYMISNVVTSGAIALFSILLVYICDYGLIGLILAYGIGYLFGNLFIAFRTRIWTFFSRKAVSLQVIKQMIRYSLPLVPNDISWWILSVSDRQIILMILGSAANGIYAIANKIPALCSTIFGMFSVSWQQSMVERIGGENWQDNANQVYNQMLQLLLPLCAGILSVSFVLFDYIFDQRYSEGYVYVPILLTAVIFSSLIQFYGGIQIALKRTGENGMTTVIGAAINLIVDIALIRFIGLYAAAVSTLVANCATAILRRYRLKSVAVFRLNQRSGACAVIYILPNRILYVLRAHLIANHQCSACSHVFYTCQFQICGHHHKINHQKPRTFKLLKRHIMSRTKSTPKKCFDGVVKVKKAEVVKCF